MTQMPANDPEKHHRQAGSDFQPAIVRARIMELVIYDVSEDELRTLEQGSPESPNLTIGIALLSFGAALLVTLNTTTIPNPKVANLLQIAVVGSFVVAVVLLIQWRRNSKMVKSVVREIRARLTTRGASQGTGAENQPGRQ